MRKYTSIVVSSLSEGRNVSVKEIRVRIFAILFLSGNNRKVLYLSINPAPLLHFLEVGVDFYPLLLGYALKPYLQ